jgi:hypothetical protein
MSNRRLICARKAAAVLCGLLLWPALTACAGGQPTSAYSPRVAERLRTDVARVRTAAEEHRRRAAGVALNRLTRHVAAAQARGGLPAAKARRILHAADMVAEDIAALPKPARVRGAQRAGREAAHDRRRETEHKRHRSPGRDRERQHDRRRHHEGDDGEKPEGWEAHKEED